MFAGHRHLEKSHKYFERSPSIEVFTQVPKVEKQKRKEQQDYLKKKVVEHHLKNNLGTIFRQRFRQQREEMLEAQKMIDIMNRSKLHSNIESNIKSLSKSVENLRKFTEVLDEIRK